MKTISYKGCRWQADIIKYAFLSSGFTLNIYKRYSNSNNSFEFVVAVLSSDGTKLHWDVFNSLKDAIEYYLGYLCSYA